jgi:hypothetical protein
MNGRAFLTAQWRRIAMLNYEVERGTLAGFVPRGTELDDWNGRSYVSVVGFLFLDTRVLGVPVPFHRDFEEVNLRFYVRRRAPDGWRRGVVFVREFVPRVAIAAVARALFNENYLAVRMTHSPEAAAPDAQHVSYTWELGGRSSCLRVSAAGPASLPPSGSHEEFIAEHYWGYSVQRDGGTREYEVEHPPWTLAAAQEAALESDVDRVYGATLGPFLRGVPASALLATGSKIRVSRGERIAG